MKLKYILTKNNGPIFFSTLINHSEMASKFGPATSAGFCQIDNFNGKVECYGKSVSLGIESDKNDAEIIMRQLSY